MNKKLPDSYIRKAIFDVFNGSIVDGKTINVYDTRYTSNTSELEGYVLMTTQANDVDYNKCSDFWESDILLEVCTLYRNTSNVGSRLFADNILEALRLALQADLDLNFAVSGLTVDNQLMTFPNDLVTNLSNATLFRKFVRLELRIK
tara:strand:- start:11707 stop:12147 length:441 start_codon:yes stop_codon:yes gene_type:complete